MKKLLVVLPTVLALMFSALGVTPVYAANIIIVNTAADEDTANANCSLREAITAANSNAAYNGCTTSSGIDTITFAGNYTITLDSQLPPVTSAIAINGKGAANTIIQASACNPVTLPGGCTPAAYKVFTVSGSAADLTLDSLTVRHGRCNGCNGGGISSTNDSNLTVTNSIISGNSAGGYAGGIYSDNNTVTVTNSTVSGNKAAQGGGGISSEYGTVTVTNSTLAGNSASGSGGGIYTYGSTSSLSITNSTLSGNSAEYGGGIYNSSNASLIIAGSTLSANPAGTGGALYNAGNMWLANSTLSGNEAYDFGGGIFNGGGAWIHNSSIVFNTLVEGTDLGAAGIDGNVALYNSIVAGNIRLFTSTYQDCSGTIHIEGVNLFSTYSNCTFSGPGSASLLNSLSLLGPLQNNGGPTKTHALLLGSTAIGTGDNTLCAAWPVLNLDQRGVTRPQGSQCDVGAYEAPQNLIISSIASQDGWILESTETSGVGGTKNNTASTLYLGDNATNRQYRSILSFNTSALPDDATISKVILRIKKAGIVGGGNPVNTFNGFMVDIKKGNFGTASLALGDFSTQASKTLGAFKPTISSGWYAINLTPGRNQINKMGNTQIRLRFKLDDNNNSVANILKLYSGNAGAANRPYLHIEYYTP